MNNCRYLFGGDWFGGTVFEIEVVGVGSAEGSELVPVVAAREYSAEAEDYYEKQGCAERESEGRP